VYAWHATDGAFDPTILRALETAGYDRTFEEVRDGGGGPNAVAVPGCEGIRLDALSRSVELPDGVAIDLGGIGKGLAADIVSRELTLAGAAGALVNVGGDLRLRGEAPTDAGWIVAIADPFHRRDLTVALSDGAIATSTTLKRCWVRAHERMHHLIDPRTGAPIDTDLVSVSVVAEDAWWAEVLTKVVFVLGPRRGAEQLEMLGVHGLLFTRERASFVAGDWRQLLP
jgi:thiamine biosynthesis lipoprotein